MRKVAPKPLRDYLKGFLSKGPYRHAVTGQYFRATVATVSGSGPYFVGLTHTGETESDNGQHLCAIPSYGPSVGDDVLCVWIDSTHAVVVQQVTGTKLSASAYRVAAFTVTVGSVRIPYDTITWDPGDHYDPTIGRYTATAPGIYRVGGCYRVTTQSEMILDLYKNGVSFKRLFLSGTAGAFCGIGSALVDLQPGEYVELFGTQPGGAQVLVGVDSVENYMDVEYVEGVNS